MPCADILSRGHPIRQAQPARYPASSRIFGLSGEGSLDGGFYGVATGSPSGIGNDLSGPRRDRPPGSANYGDAVDYWQVFACDFYRSS